MRTFLEDLENLINQHSLEGESNTPDFVLAKFLRQSLAAFDFATNNRTKWFSSNVPGFMANTPTGRVLMEVQGERTAQDDRWGGPSHDDTHVPGDWLAFCRRRIDLANNAVTVSPLAYRTYMIELAALAVAAIESHDRLIEPPYASQIDVDYSEEAAAVPVADRTDPYEGQRELKSAEVVRDEEHGDLLLFLVSRGAHGKVPTWYLKALVCGRYGYSLRQLDAEPELLAMAVAALSIENEAIDHQNRMAADRQQGRA